VSVQLRASAKRKNIFSHIERMTRTPDLRALCPLRLSRLRCCLARKSPANCWPYYLTASEIQ